MWESKWRWSFLQFGSNACSARVQMMRPFSFSSIRSMVGLDANCATQTNAIINKSLAPFSNPFRLLCIYSIWLGLCVCMCMVQWYHMGIRWYLFVSMNFYDFASNWRSFVSIFFDSTSSMERNLKSKLNVCDETKTM